MLVAAPFPTATSCAWVRICSYKAIVAVIRCDIQLCGEQGAAGFVLGERGAALAGLRQQAHELAVGGFVPRVELQQALGVGGGGVELARGRGLVDELLVGRNRQGAQALAFQQRPLLKGRAAVEIEARQKVAAIERNGQRPSSPAARWRSNCLASRSTTASGLSASCWRVISR